VVLCRLSGEFKLLSSRHLKNKEKDMKKTRVSRLLFALAAAAVLLPGCAKKENVIKLGLNAPLTGSNAQVGESAKNGVDMIVEKVNAEGGLDVKGTRYKIQMVYENNQGDPNTSANITTKMIEQDKILALIGPGSSVRTEPAAQICNDSHVPMISFWATVPTITKNRPYVFRSCFTDDFHAEKAAKYAVEAYPVTKIAILYNIDDAWSKSISAIFRNQWESYKGKGSVVHYESFNEPDQDFSAQLTKIINSDAELLYLPIWYTHVALAVPQAKALGWNKDILGGDGWASAALWSASKGSVAGYRFTCAYASSGAVGKTKEFIDAYDTKYGYIPDDVSALSYDALMIVLQAIQSEGLTGDLTKDREAIKGGMAAIKNYSGVTGDMVFTEDGDPIKPVVVVKISDTGEFEYETSIMP
jgi:branched-chain amino acid transport system substrate-binding protein